MSTEISELTDTELDAVSGGGSGAHIQDAIIETFGGGGGGGGGGGATTPAGAWNACLGVFGYDPQA
jgi:bacteriocin-like protein